MHTECASCRRHSSYCMQSKSKAASSFSLTKFSFFSNGFFFCLLNSKRSTLPRKTRNCRGKSTWGLEPATTKPISTKRPLRSYDNQSWKEFKRDKRLLTQSQKQQYPFQDHAARRLVKTYNTSIIKIRLIPLTVYGSTAYVFLISLPKVVKKISWISEKSRNPCEGFCLINMGWNTYFCQK